VGNRHREIAFLGKKPTRNHEISAAVETLRREPRNAMHVRSLVAAICAALERGPSRRVRISSKGLGKSSAALLRTYAPRLNKEVAEKVRELCRERFPEILGRRGVDASRSIVAEHQAAIALGVGVGDLHRMMRDPKVRRALGWPRPLGGHVLFAQAVFDPSLADAYLKKLPDAEPWPRDTWPEDWR
jgi:nucleoside-diphosphate-sugar epimerase